MDFRSRVRAVLPPLVVSREPEIVAEIAEHLSDLYDEARAEGLSHAAAVARAEAALPQYVADFVREIEAAVEPLPERVVHRWQRTLDDPPPGGFTMLTDVRGDLRYALRGLLKTPGLTVSIVLTLALGIGANSVIFSAIDALLLRPVAVGDPDTLVRVYTGGSDGDRFGTSSYPDYVSLRDEAGFARLATFGNITMSLDAQGTTTGIDGQVVSGNYFDVLGVGLALGRGFLPQEDRVGSPTHVAVISHGTWQTRFGGDPAVVGRTATLNGTPYTIVGVAPRGFAGPILGQSPDVWVPMALQPEVRPPSAGLRRNLGSAEMFDVRGVRWLHMVGRRPEGAGLESIRSTLDVMARRLEAAYPESNSDRRFAISRLGEGPGVRTAARPLLGVLGVAVLLVLLIACANVANLLIVRALARQKEVAVRLAVGASRLRLVRQWLTESVLLALLGAAGGLVVAWWTTPVLYGFGVPASIDLSLNARVVVFTAAIAVASALLFGCASVLQVLGRDMLTPLREEGRGTTTSARVARWRGAFVVAQVALSLVLLVGAGLFLRTLQNAYAVDLGYPVERMLVTAVNLDVRGYSPDAGQVAYDEMLRRIVDVPGVTAAGAARVAVLSGAARSTLISTDGTEIERDDPNVIVVRTNVVSHGYLETLGVPLLRGRDFGRQDRATSPRVAIVSQSLADRLWPDTDPIGQTLIGTGLPLEVIGIVPDVVYVSPVESEAPGFFLSLLAQNYESGVTLHVRTAIDPIEVFPAVRQAVREVDPLLTLTPPRRFSAVLNQSLGDQRMMARLVAAFGAVALLLAVIGLYGVMAHLVAQRRPEIGVRLALGATPQSVFTLVLRQGLGLVLIGLPIGLAAAAGASRYVRSQLFGVDPFDPLVVLSVCALFLTSAVLACIVPARRAVAIDPTVVLK